LIYWQMTFCTNCGIELAPNPGNFCSSCGANLPNNISSAKEEENSLPTPPSYANAVPIQAQMVYGMVSPDAAPQTMNRSTDPLTREELYDTKKFANGGPRNDQDLCCLTLCCAYNFAMCPLHCLSTWGCTRTVDCLTSLPCKHIPCSPCDPNGKMPLWFFSEPIGWAASHGQLHTVMVLVKNGANPERVNGANQTAFTDALREQHQHIVDWLNIWRENPNK